MDKVIIPKETANKIEAIFQHPGNVYSIELKGCGDTIWVEGKIELYIALQSI